MCCGCVHVCVYVRVCMCVCNRCSELFFCGDKCCPHGVNGLSFLLCLQISSGLSKFKSVEVGQTQNFVIMLNMLLCKCVCALARARILVCACLSVALSFAVTLPPLIPTHTCTNTRARTHTHALTLTLHTPQPPPPLLRWPRACWADTWGWTER